VVFGDTRSNEFVSDAVVESVVVNPDFMVADFGIKNEGMNSLLVNPAFVDYEVACFVVCNNQLAKASFWVTVEEFAVFFYDALQLGEGAI